MPRAFGATDYLAVLPPILMAIFGSTSLLLGFAAGKALPARRSLVWFNLVATCIVGWALFGQWRLLRHTGHGLAALQGTVSIDGLSVFVNGLIWAVTLGLLLISYRYLDTVHEHAAEYYGLALFAQCGMYFMAAGADLVALVVGLELTSISFYILVGFTRANRRSNEAALKYLLLGALSSAFVLYGFSLLYGMCGSTGLADISAALAGGQVRREYVVLGTVASVVGLLFKVSAAPFHNWAPDAYEGAPTPITGYLAVASNIASFAVLLRVLAALGREASAIWTPLLVGAAILSLAVGTFAALTQTGLKRLFAYSGVAHAGYLLLGIIANSALGTEGVYVYLLVYAVMNGGAFALLTSLQAQGRSGDSLTDLGGLSQRHPLHAAFFVILLLSLAGIPPTAGFIGKYFIFAALLQTGHTALAIVASVFAVVGLYFYFRLVREMYVGESLLNLSGSPVSIGIRLALGATAGLTVLIGLFPEAILRSTVLVTGMVP